MNARAGPLHREFEQVQDVAVGDLRGAGRTGLVVLDELALLFDFFVHRADGERARHFAGRMAAHSVGHDEKGELLVDEVVVLVVVADATDVGRGKKVNVLLQAHCADEAPELSISKLSPSGTMLELRHVR